MRYHENNYQKFLPQNKCHQTIGFPDSIPSETRSCNHPGGGCESNSEGMLFTKRCDP